MVLPLALQASQLKRFPSEQYKCFMQIRRHPPTHILTGAVVRLNQYVSPHHPRIAYSQIRSCKIWRKRQNHHIRIANMGDLLNVKENLKKETKLWIFCSQVGQKMQNHLCQLYDPNLDLKPELCNWSDWSISDIATDSPSHCSPIPYHTIPYKSRGLSLVLYHTIHPEPHPTQTVTLHLPYTGPPLNGLQWHPIRIWFFLTLSSSPIAGLWRPDNSLIFLI